MPAARAALAAWPAQVDWTPMLRTRLIVGTILVALTAGMLVWDERLAPWFPFLFATVLLLSVLGTVELVRLLPEPKRPNLTLCLGGVFLLVMLNWGQSMRLGQLKGFSTEPTHAWWFIGQGLAVIILLAFLVEMANFRQPGGAVEAHRTRHLGRCVFGVASEFLAATAS